MTHEKEREPQKELSLKTYKENLSAIVDLIKEDFLGAGTRFGLGVLSETPSLDMLSSQVEEPDAWTQASDQEKEEFLELAIKALGLVPEQLTAERAKRTSTDKGIRGEASEGGAEVMVFQTKFPRLKLYVLDYGDPTIGRRYDLVVSE